MLYQIIFVLLIFSLLVFILVQVKGIMPKALTDDDLKRLLEKRNIRVLEILSYEPEDINRFNHFFLVKHSPNWPEFENTKTFKDLYRDLSFTNYISFHKIEAIIGDQKKVLMIKVGRGTYTDKVSVKYVVISDIEDE